MLRTAVVVFLPSKSQWLYMKDHRMTPYD